MTGMPKPRQSRAALDHSPLIRTDSSYPRWMRFALPPIALTRARCALCSLPVAVVILAMTISGCTAPSPPTVATPPSATPASTAHATTAPAMTPSTDSRVSDEVPALRTGTIEEAEKAVGLTVRLPSYLPEGTERDGPARYFVRNGQGMVSIAYRVGLHGVAIEYLKLPVDQMPEIEGQPVTVRSFQAVAYTQPKEPSDPLPPETQLSWRDGDAIVLVRGDLPINELIKVAESLYHK